MGGFEAAVVEAATPEAGLRFTSEFMMGLSLASESIRGPLDMLLLFVPLESNLGALAALASKSVEAGLLRPPFMFL